MTELKPIEQYEVTPILPSDNGQKRAEATIDEPSRQAAMARAMLDNMKRQREQACGAEIDKALTAILKKYNCNAQFRELRVGGQTTRIWIQPVALDEPVTQG